MKVTCYRKTYNYLPVALIKPLSDSNTWDVYHTRRYFGLVINILANVLFFISLWLFFYHSLPFKDNEPLQGNATRPLRMKNIAIQSNPFERNNSINNASGSFNKAGNFQKGIIVNKTIPIRYIYPNPEHMGPSNFWTKVMAAFSFACMAFVCSYILPLKPIEVETTPWEA